MDIQCVLAFLGLIWIVRWEIYLILDLIGAFRKFVWARLFPYNLHLKYGGKWAVVTGCTDGIGKEYAKQLATKGMNILLIARNIDKLNNVKQIIKDESPNVETEVIQVDFSHGRVIYDKIASHLPGKDIGILVNNVGVVLKPLKKFEEVTEDEIWNHVNVNMGSMAAMTHLILPAMLKRGNGAIINVGSGASSAPLPFIGIYSGTKAFVEFFSESLSWELRNTGITVQLIRPCAVITNMINYQEGFEKPSLIAPSTETFVNSALPTLGHSRRTSGYWTHGLQEFMLDEMFNRRMITAGYGNLLEKYMAKLKEKKKDK